MRKRGFTLIETILYVGILGLMASSLALFGFSVGSSRTKTAAAEEVNANIRTAFDVLASRVRSSNGVIDVFSVFGSDPGAIALGMPDPAKNPTVFRLNADDGVLEIKEGAGPWMPLTSSAVRVTNFIFEKASAPGMPESIVFDIAVEHADTSGSADYRFTQSVHSAVTLRMCDPSVCPL